MRRRTGDDYRRYGEDVEVRRHCCQHPGGTRPLARLEVGGDIHGYAPERGLLLLTREAASVFVSGNFVNFKLSLRPSGCSQNLQEIQGCQRKTRGISGTFGGPPTILFNILNN